jgi:endonuclease-8
MPEGHTIHRIARDHARLLAGRPLRVTSPQGRFATDAQRVDGAVLERLEAYGKHLFSWWSTGDVGHVHLGLFGKFRVHRGEPPEPRGAVRMRLETLDATGDDPERVTIELRGPTACTIGTPDDRAAIVDRLGPDPLRDDADPERAIAKLARSKRALADLLLDQSVIAGVGNVYRAELLFVHGIHPERPGSRCERDELAELWATAARFLRAGVRANRIVTVDRDEIGWPKGRRIPRREATYVYRREHCVRCGTPIATAEIANRTCYFCPTDQHR